MGITFEPEPIRAVAKQLRDGTWLVACRCPQRGVWGWDRLPKAKVVSCPCDGCPFQVRVFAMWLIRPPESGEGGDG